MNESERVMNLEERYAHLEKLVSELSDVVYRQQQEIESLRHHVSMLKDKVGGDPGIVDPSQQERPPHY
ncbi:MAG: SlyX family protein [Myxococcaceae bacterium]|nr:SlyX family protein [Myxococcaceae bacterium]